MTKPDPRQLDPLKAIGADLIKLQRAKKEPVSKPVLDADGKRAFRVNRKGIKRPVTTWDRISPAEAVAWMNQGDNVGWVIGRDHLACDFDPRNYPPGVDTEAQILEALGLKDWSGFAVVNTPSGGKHVIMKTPPDVLLVSTDKDKFPGLDLKRGRAYVVTAGSIHPNGGVYRWSGDTSLERTGQAPDALIDMFKIAKPPTDGRRGDGSDGADDWGSLDEEQIENALSHIPAEKFNHQNELWLRFAMSCHWLTAGEGREQFLDWCATDDEYSDAAMRDLNGQRWDSFGREGKHGSWADRRVKGGLLYVHLKEEGVERRLWPQLRAERDFQDVDPEENEEFCTTMDQKDETASMKTEKQLKEAGAKTLSNLEEMNAKHAKVELSGKTFYTSDGFEAGKQKRFYVSQEDILQKYRHVEIQVPKVSKGGVVVEPMQLGKWWLDHPEKRQYDGTDFRKRVAASSDIVTPDGARLLNLFTGFAFDPAPAADGFAAGWPLMHRVILEAICDGDTALCDYVLKWMAWTYQTEKGNPGVAILLHGPEQGTGKTTLTEVWSAPFGAHASSGDNLKTMLTGENVGFLETCAALVINEAGEASEDMRNARGDGIGAIKSRITDNFRISEKYQPSRQIENNLAVMFTTNKTWALDVAPTDRRWLVLGVNPKFADDYDFWQKLRREMFTGADLREPGAGCRAFFGDLMRLDISTFNPRRDRPKTRAWRRMRAQTEGPIVEFFRQCLERGSFPGQLDADGARPFRVVKSALARHARSFIRDHSRALGGDWDMVPERALSDFCERYFGVSREFPDDIDFLRSRRARIAADVLLDLALTDEADADGRVYVLQLPPIPEQKRRLAEALGVEFEPDEDEIARLTEELVG